VIHIDHTVGKLTVPWLTAFLQCLSGDICNRLASHVNGAGRCGTKVGHSEVQSCQRSGVQPFFLPYNLFFCARFFTFKNH
jgi:hypothetical protein